MGPRTEMITGKRQNEVLPVFSVWDNSTSAILLEVNITKHSYSQNKAFQKVELGY